MFEVLVSGLLFSHLFFCREDLPRASALQGGRWCIHFIGAQINKVPIVQIFLEVIFVASQPTPM